jgi:hypothetical protein
LDQNSPKFGHKKYGKENSTGRYPFLRRLIIRSLKVGVVMKKKKGKKKKGENSKDKVIRSTYYVVYYYFVHKI